MEGVPHLYMTGHDPIYEFAMDRSKDYYPLFVFLSQENNEKDQLISYLRSEIVSLESQVDTFRRRLNLAQHINRIMGQETDRLERTIFDNHTETMNVLFTLEEVQKENARLREIITRHLDIVDLSGTTTETDSHVSESEPEN